MSKRGQRRGGGGAGEVKAGQTPHSSWTKEKPIKLASCLFFFFLATLFIFVLTLFSIYNWGNRRKSQQFCEFSLHSSIVFYAVICAELFIKKEILSSLSRFRIFTLLCVSVLWISIRQTDPDITRLLIVDSAFPWKTTTTKNYKRYDDIVSRQLSFAMTNHVEEKYCNVLMRKIRTTNAIHAKNEEVLLRISWLIDRTKEVLVAHRVLR